MSITIRPAKKTDSASILQLINDLARYEKAHDQVEITAETLVNDGFGSNPKFCCLVAELENVVVGMALTYPRYSTWKGAYIYLEDLVVDANFRNRGIGGLLLKAVIGKAAENNSARLEWQVLDWNEPAISFYRKFNASFDN
jgi:GNAT superfamily N-acetyltransferase